MSRGLSATCGSMAHSVVELTVVLTKLASGGRRGESCARPGVALRVVAPELLFSRRPCADSRAVLTEDWRPHNGGRGTVPSVWVPTVLGMLLQCLRWPRRAGGDWEDAPHWSYVTASSPVGVE
jgi:hypothetical protein